MASLVCELGLNVTGYKKLRERRGETVGARQQHRQRRSLGQALGRIHI